MIAYAVALFTMILMSIGQILLKSLAMRIPVFQTAGAVWRGEIWKFVILGTGVFITYLVVLGCWLYVLKNMSLNRGFAFVALTFIFVPLFSHLILDEKITVGASIGSLLIITGIIVSVSY